MNRFLVCLFYLSGLTAFPPLAGAQCGYTAIIAATKGFCTGNQLRVASSHAFSDIVWYKDGTPVKKVNATQHLNTTGVVFAAPSRLGGVDTGVQGYGRLAFDTAGNLYACQTNYSIRKYPPGGGVGVLAAGVNGRGRAASQLDGPLDLFVDRRNNLYVLDRGNNRIQKFAPGDTAATTVGVVAKGAAPSGLYVDCMGNVYTSDDAASAVIRFSPGSMTPSIVAGGKGAGTGPGQLDQPGYVWVDPVGNIFVSDGIVGSADPGNTRITEWKPGAAAGIVVAGGHGYGYGHDQISYLVWMDGKDNMYVVNNNNTSGGLNIRIDTWPLGAGGGTTFLGDNGEGSALNQFGNGISGFTEDAKGNVYVSDPNLERILTFQR